jgi:hypothetical protein
MEANQGVNGISNLWQIQVRVYRELDSGQKVEVSLGQMILDPSIRGAPNPPPTSTTTSSSTGGTTTGG